MQLTKSAQLVVRKRFPQDLHSFFPGNVLNIIFFYLENSVWIQESNLNPITRRFPGETEAEPLVLAAFQALHERKILVEGAWLLGSPNISPSQMEESEKPI